MQKGMIQNVELMTRMQETECMIEGRCYRGVFSKVGETRYLFEEAVTTSRCGLRNPKLFEGDYISLVHRQKRTLPGAHADDLAGRRAGR